MHSFLNVVVFSHIMSYIMRLETTSETMYYETTMELHSVYNETTTVYNETTTVYNETTTVYNETTTVYNGTTQGGCEYVFYTFNSFFVCWYDSITLFNIKTLSTHS